MKNLFSLLFLIFCTNCSFAQLKATLIDSETQEPVPYVNIWIENKSIGTTSDENGKFTLNVKSSENILFSAIGYETTKISAKNIQKAVQLKPQNIELGEVVVTPQKHSKELVTDKFKKGKINHYFGCGKNLGLSHDISLTIQNMPKPLF